MIQEILQFVLPAWGTNVALNLLHPLSVKFPFVKNMNTPLDQGAYLKNKRLLGDSTTLLGLFTALVFGVITQIVFTQIPSIIISFGMYLGHTIGSFIKRRAGVKGGEFIPFLDHGDGIITTGIILIIFNLINFPVFIYSVLLTYITYPILCIAGHKLKLRKRPL